MATQGTSCTGDGNLPAWVANCSTNQEDSIPSLTGVVHYSIAVKTLRENNMTMKEELTVPQAAAFLKVSEETVRRNIRARRLNALRKGTQWFIPRESLVVFANAYDPKTGRIRQLL